MITIFIIGVNMDKIFVLIKDKCIEELFLKKRKIHLLLTIRMMKVLLL